MGKKWEKNDKFPEMLEILQHCNEEYVPNNDDMSKRVIFFRLFIITSIAGKNLWNKNVNITKASYQWTTVLTSSQTTATLRL